MCFTIPKKILEMHVTTATIEGNMNVDISGIEKCTIGDYILVTDTIAIQKLSVEEAMSMRTLIKETHDQL